MAAKTTLETLSEIPEEASDAEKSLPLADKLQLLDKEIRLLHDHCAKFGLSSKEIEFCAEPLLKEQNFKWWTRVLYTSIFVAFISFILWYDPTYRIICIIGKLSSMKLLPYWDWTTEFDKDCFVENPYYVEDVLTQEDCEGCRNLSGSRLTNVSQDDMADKYLFSEIPVIVTDATRDWPVNLKSINTNRLREVYLDEKNAQAVHSCQFDAFDPDIESTEQLFSLLQDHSLDQWQGYWENCEAATAKSIRKFYRRPYFLPPMAESGSENWIFSSFVTSDEKNNLNWEQVSFGGSATWITQIRGMSKIVLAPEVPCEKICTKMSAVLKPGETLVFGNRLWRFKRKPYSGEESISLASTVSWDQL